MHPGFLPLTVRELRAAARRKGTARLRWWSALFAIIASFAWLAGAPYGGVTGRFTNTLFSAQTGCAFVFVLLAGAFLTSDCLSEEKRDGTLELLFLAGLRPRDIILGKFFGVGLEAFYVLFALLPITAVAMFVGGLGFAEFWRVALTLLNTLFFSLTVGLCVSAFVTSYAKALSGTLSLLLLFGAGLPLLANISSLPAIAWASPACSYLYARDIAYGPNRYEFWFSLVFCHSLAWVFLALAERGLRNSSFEKEASPAKARWIESLPGLRRKSRAFLDARHFNPVLQFIGNSPALRWMAWILVLLYGALAWMERATGYNLAPAKIIAFLLKILVAFQACRFFVETRRNGALEVLLCTPLKNAEIIRAQWNALLRAFLGPLLVFLLLCWVTFALAPPGRPVYPTMGGGQFGLETGFLGIFVLTIGMAIDVLAIGWFGMWVALTIRKPDLAPALTVVSVLVLPGLIPYFDLVVDMFFISWGVTRFQQEFRWVVATLLPRPALQR